MSETAPEAEAPPVPITVVMSAVFIANKDGSFGFDIETDLSPEIAESLLRTAADDIGGKNDRAAGAWGRP